MIELAGPDDDLPLRQFFAQKTGVDTTTERSRVLGFKDSTSGEILGVWLFERYTGVTGSVHSHWAGKDGPWLTKDMLTLVAVYVFDQLGCSRVYGEVAASDTYVRKVNEKLGFREVAVLHGYFPDDDLVIYSLEKRDCRWLPAGFKEVADGQAETAERA